MDTTIRILSVEDHGVWRGRRTWTIHIEEGAYQAQVSVVNVETDKDARAEAIERTRTRRRFTDAEREALAASSKALGRVLGSQVA